MALSLCVGLLGCVEGRLEVGPGTHDAAADAALPTDATAPDDATGHDDADRDFTAPDAAEDAARRGDGAPPHDGAPHDGALSHDGAPHDGALPPHDGALPPHDGALPPHDGALPPHDGALPPPDAEPPPPDAEPPPPDAEPPPPDAEPPPPDAEPPPPDAAEPPPLPPCPGFDAARVTGNLADPAIVEASGIAQSWRNADVLWTHNDSGDISRVFALTTAGQALGVYELDGGRPSDWEDMGVGPGPQPGVTYLYMGDVGDNASRRANVRVRRIPEPEVPRGGAPVSVRLAGAESLTLVYPDGAHNCETLLVDPLNGDVYVVVKSNDGVSPVYRAAAPLVPDADNRMVRVANLRFGQAPLRGNTLTTGGSIARDGSAILIRTYGSAFLWRRVPGATVGEALATEACPVPRAGERQGEAIGFAADGSGYYTVSEGAAAPIHFYRRR